ncbi:yeats-domain-containing protein [Thelephora ganbajun]|uniref:Yeats-domain-containing protein n=1 Tax=Thelephora ganbajun TaxID=370292 RepID=A0ACB6ZQ54_THEGA|nr:yeats-domain-containing protein [Thelephora ganbajun]
MAADRVRVRGLSVHRPIIYGNSASVLTPKERESAPDSHTHRWTVAVRSAASNPNSDVVGGADDLGYFIKRVTFKLHDTYQNSVRNIDKPPFEVSETGWGEFEIAIRISFVPEAGEKQMTLYHHLKLHPWVEGEGSGPPPLDQAVKLGPVHSWQYDEVVFIDPFQSFLNVLTSYPPTPLPRVSKKPVPYNAANPASLEASRGGVPEFTQAMEKEEAERLEAAKKAVIMEQERLRLRLHEREKELEVLKQQLGEA